MPCPSPAYEVYERNMILTGNGWPQFSADPDGNSTLYEDSTTGLRWISIGDVGYSERGRFHRIKNIIRDVFLTFPLEPQICQESKSLRKPITGGSAKLVDLGGDAALSPGAMGLSAGGSVGWKLEFERGEGAVLNLESGAAVFRYLTKPDSNRLGNYMLQNYKSWLRESDFFSLKPSDLILITGTYMTENWEAATFQSSSTYLSANCPVYLLDNQESLSISWRNWTASNHGYSTGHTHLNSSHRSRTAPLSDPQVTTPSNISHTERHPDSGSHSNRSFELCCRRCAQPPQNQCIFLHGWRIRQISGLKRSYPIPLELKEPGVIRTIFESLWKPASQLPPSMARPMTAFDSSASLSTLVPSDNDDVMETVLEDLGFTFEMGGSKLDIYDITAMILAGKQPQTLQLVDLESENVIIHDIDVIEFLETYSEDLGINVQCSLEGFTAHDTGPMEINPTDTPHFGSKALSPFLKDTDQLQITRDPYGTNQQPHPTGYFPPCPQNQNYERPGQNYHEPTTQVQDTSSITNYLPLGSSSGKILVSRSQNVSSPVPRGPIPQTKRSTNQNYNTVGNAQPSSHKRPKATPAGDDIDAYYDDDEEETVASGRTLRASGACAPCKRLKIRCVFESQRSQSCENCIKRGNKCTISKRKPQKAPPKQDELIKSIRDKDALIQRLIEQLEARSSSITPMSLFLTGQTALAAQDSSTLTDPLAREAVRKEMLRREKEIRDWIEKTKATADESNAMDFKLLGGTGNPILSDGDDSNYDSSDYAIESDQSGAESGQDPTSPLSASGEGDRIRRQHVKGGKSLVSSQSRKSGSGDPNDMKRVSVLSTRAPLGLIAQVGRSFRRRRSSRRSPGASPHVSGELADTSGTTGGPGMTGDDDDDGDEIGISNPSFFSPSKKPYMTTDGEKLDLPPILAKNIIGPKEVKELFDVYFEYMNLSTCLLDPRLYTPEKTLYRSSFLFTVVCAIASRYHPSRTNLYPTLMNYARLAAGTATISGRKSLEACQAYILLSLYPMPARRWSEDRSWIYLGCAIRMATDLNLHHPPVLEGGEPAVTISTIMDAEWQSREILNRTRCWLGCFNADKAMSTQFGKPTTLREDWMFPLLQRNISEGGAEWWCPTPYGWKFDIHLCAHSALLREISSFHEKIYSDPSNPNGLNKDINFEELTYEFDNRIEEMAKEWFHRINTHIIKDDPECIFRKDLLQLEFHYNRLVALSFGFQHAFRGGTIQKDNRFLQRCYAAATRVVRIVVDRLGNQKYMRYCPESHYIFATFASAFLLKLLRPKFSALLEAQQHHEIIDLVNALTVTLNRIAIDDRHAPKLYSRFLLRLVNEKSRKILASGSSISGTLSTRSSYSPYSIFSAYSASSSASIAAANTGSIPAAYPRKFSVSSSGNSFMPDLKSSTNASGTYAQQNQHIPNQDSYDDTSALDTMDVVQDSLPQSSWPHATSMPPGDGDTLMHMSLFGDQFWEDGLLPGFSWGDSTNVHHDNNIVRNYSDTVPPVIRVSFDNTTGFSPSEGVSTEPPTSLPPNESSSSSLWQ